jgi:hypothetical protein
MLAEALMSRKQQTAQESAIFFTLSPNLITVSTFLAFEYCSCLMCLFVVLPSGLKIWICMGACRYFLRAINPGLGWSD